MRSNLGAAAEEVVLGIRLDEKVFSMRSLYFRRVRLLAVDF